MKLLINRYIISNNPGFININNKFEKMLKVFVMYEVLLPFFCNCTIFDLNWVFTLISSNCATNTNTSRAKKKGQLREIV